MIIEDGEKYACEYCIRGHRVSSCSHKDRPLHHINRKGRPVSQCQHCRGLRKARAAHVKCECGEHAHSRQNSSDKVIVTASDSSPSPCSCQTGKKCICSIKKENVDEDMLRLATTTLLQKHNNSGSKPAMPNRRSESSVPRLRNGLHPLINRLNNAAHELGQPYPPPRLSAGFRPYHHAQRSVDSLPLLTYATSSGQDQMQGLPSFSRAGSTQDDWGTNMPSQQPRNAPRQRPTPMPRADTTPFPIDSTINNGSFPSMPTIDLTSAYNIGFVNSQLSPGNPQRYSINDFSMLMSNGYRASGDFGSYQQTPMSAETDPKGFNWHEWDFPSSTDLNDMAQANPVAASEISIDITPSQPDLSRSSSATISEPREARFQSAISTWNNDVNAMQSRPPHWTLEQEPNSVYLDAASAAGSYQDLSSTFAFPASAPTISLLDVKDQYGSGMSELNTSNLALSASDTQGAPYSAASYSTPDNYLEGLTSYADDNFHSSWTPSSEPDYNGVLHGSEFGEVFDDGPNNSSMSANQQSSQLTQPLSQSHMPHTQPLAHSTNTSNTQHSFTWMQPQTSGLYGS